MYLIMKGENKQNVYVKEIQKNRVKRAEKQKTGIGEEKYEPVPVFCLYGHYIYSISRPDGSQWMRTIRFSALCSIKS